MFYFSHMARHHNFDRHQANEDWERAGMLEKAYEQTKDIQQSLKQNKENNEPS